MTGFSKIAVSYMKKGKVIILAEKSLKLIMLQFYEVGLTLYHSS